MASCDELMLMAIGEAELSLREGNCGFGAVVARNGEPVARAHDTEKTDHDPTAHAELKAIRNAAALLRGDFRGCGMVSTHEPCPMCAAAVLWAGIETVAYGFSIREAIEQGRRRIDLPCREIFERAGKRVEIREGILRERCAVLYHGEVRAQVDFLRNADRTALEERAETLTRRRLAWLDAHRPVAGYGEGDLLDTAYTVLLDKLGLDPRDAPVVERERDRLVFASGNFCPTLEACRILGLDTRFVCRCLTEGPTDALLRGIDPRLRFSRNYPTLRPHGGYCEERISIEG